jgi:hypothetical protein
MFDRPITQFLDLSLFPEELMELKGEAYVLGDSTLPIVISPDGMRNDAVSLDIYKCAKNKKLLLKSFMTIKTGIEFLTVIVKNHDFGSIEMKHATAVIVIGLESLDGNHKDTKFRNESLEGFRNIKLCITRSRRFKTWYKIYNTLNKMRSEFPKLNRTITNLMYEVHGLLIGTDVGHMNLENWSKVMHQKPPTL